MKIFVTGATGFIGSHFLDLAVASGHVVVALRRDPAGTPKIRLNRQPMWLDKQMGQVVAADLIDVDVVVHLAAHSANFPYDTLERCMHWNLMEPLRLFEVARLAGVRRYVVAGSCFEYGRAGVRYDSIPADAPLEPIQTYPASKAAASLAFIQWAQEYGLILSILRPFQVFGEGESPTRLWPSLREAALKGCDFELGPADQIRDFVNVHIVARRFWEQVLALYEASGSFVRVENVGSGVPQSVYLFAQSVWLSMGAKGRLLKGALPRRSGDVMRFVPDLTPVFISGGSVT